MSITYGIDGIYELQKFLDGLIKKGAMSVYLTKDELKVIYEHDRFRGTTNRLPMIKPTEPCASYLGRLNIYLEKDGGIK